MGAERLSSHTYVNPVVAVALGAWLAGEAVGARMLFASVMILTAVLLLLRRKGRAARGSGAEPPLRVAVPSCEPMRSQ